MGQRSQHENALARAPLLWPVDRHAGDFADQVHADSHRWQVGDVRLSSRRPVRGQVATGARIVDDARVTPTAHRQYVQDEIDKRRPLIQAAGLSAN